MFLWHARTACTFATDLEMCPGIGSSLEPCGALLAPRYFFATLAIQPFVSANMILAFLILFLVDNL